MSDIEVYKKKLEALRKKKLEDQKKKEEEEAEKKLQEEAEKAKKAEEEAKESQAAESETAQPKPEYSVFIGKVHPKVRKEALEAHFSCCGEIKRTTIVCDHYTHMPKGYAYIEFASQEGVDNALKLNESILEGQTLEVKIKRGKDSTRPIRRGPRRRFRRM
ncbi:Polyadenylate-binding protein 2 [Tritrichomonas foetus]|uniref:Polyadenylate-binding protein 2 n=1 Tax=Tritrichomonas foetus TaxID=1144522 RepID=A0A1J4JN64_9EUKA|nr:Polyadenylate-binding protein 2 [Tritrichomonas foetus]|eukprot:OHS98987.1 Polyadenylate-binding protein 2 [Tritrichomonas foetus]